MAIARKDKYDKEVERKFKHITCVYQRHIDAAENIDELLYFFCKAIESNHSCHERKRPIQTIDTIISIAEGFDDWRKIFFATFHKPRHFSEECIMAFRKMDELKSGEQEYEDFSYCLREIQSCQKREIMAFLNENPQYKKYKKAQ